MTDGLVSIFDHAPTVHFVQRQYDNLELTKFVRELSISDSVRLSRRMLERIKDLVLDPFEVFTAVETGSVVLHEIGPSRTEMRLEIELDEGDIARYRVVVWLSMNHRLFAEDIRDRPLSARQ